MPVYEYWCNNCMNKVDLYFARFTCEVPACPKCNRKTMKRIFSTFAVQKSYQDVYDGILSDSQLIKGMMHNDPKALAEWNKRMSCGEPVAPEYRETLERMGRGEIPETSSDGSLPDSNTLTIEEM